MAGAWPWVLDARPPRFAVALPLRSGLYVVVFAPPWLPPCRHPVLLGNGSAVGRGASCVPCGFVVVFAFVGWHVGAGWVVPAAITTTNYCVCMRYVRTPLAQTKFDLGPVQTKFGLGGIECYFELGGNESQRARSYLAVLRLWHVSHNDWWLAVSQNKSWFPLWGTMWSTTVASRPHSAQSGWAARNFIRYARHRWSYPRWWAVPR